MNFPRRFRRGFGADTTADPPPSYYCQPQIAQIASLNAQMANMGSQITSLNNQLTAAKANAAGVADGCNRGMSDLQNKLTAATSQIATLTNERDLAVNKSCPLPPVCSCKWWIIATVVASSVAVVSVVRKNKGKDKKADKHASLS